MYRSTDKAAFKTARETVYADQGAKAFVKLARPIQWAKNLIVFAGIIFSGKVLQTNAQLNSALAFLAFCLISSAVYAVNDIFDIEKDRLHPKKRYRPIAAGVISVGKAAVFACVLAAAGLTAGFAIYRPVGFCCLGYIILNITYSRWFKHMVILDVMLVASGFVLRAVGGALAVYSMVSPWLLMCTILLALLLSLGKRRCEIMTLDKTAGDHRPILEQYSLGFLDQMISCTSAATIMAYSMYSFFSPTARHAPYLMLTIPFVLYGVFRYLYLVYHVGKGGEPELLFIGDKPLLVNILLWVGTSGAIIFFRK